MKNDIYTCKYCGRKIGIITGGIYRKTVVDAEAVMVIADPEGETFLRVDGTKVRAREAAYEEAGAEPAYRPHRKNGGVPE